MPLFESKLFITKPLLALAIYYSEKFLIVILYKNLRIKLRLRLDRRRLFYSTKPAPNLNSAENFNYLHAQKTMLSK